MFHCTPKMHPCPRKALKAGKRWKYRRHTCGEVFFEPVFFNFEVDQSFRLKMLQILSIFQLLLFLGSKKRNYRHTCGEVFFEPVLQDQSFRLKVVQILSGFKY